MNCELSCLIVSKKIYTVMLDDMVYPPALFLCLHCAIEWGDEKYSPKRYLRPSFSTSSKISFSIP